VLGRRQKLQTKGAVESFVLLLEDMDFRAKEKLSAREKGRDTPEMVSRPNPAAFLPFLQWRKCHRQPLSPS
jgi:hypothetical protein